MDISLDCRQVNHVAYGHRSICSHSRSIVALIHNTKYPTKDKMATMKSPIIVEKIYSNNISWGHESDERVMLWDIYFLWSFNFQHWLLSIRWCIRWSDIILFHWLFSIPAVTFPLIIHHCFIPTVILINFSHHSSLIPTHTLLLLLVDSYIVPTHSLWSTLSFMVLAESPLGI